MREEDRRYYRLRAAEERKRAEEASDEFIRHVHLQFAKVFEDRLQEWATASVPVASRPQPHQQGSDSSHFLRTWAT
jgi:hypothetical protein